MNGILISGAKAPEEFYRLIDAELARAGSAAPAPASPAKPASPAEPAAGSTPKG